MPSLLQTLAQRCRQTRTELDLTQQQLADRVGLKRGYVAMIEGGRANPSLKAVERLARALDMEVDLVIRPPQVVGSPGVRDGVHARCSGHVDRRLRSAGLLVAREVEIVHARSHGWIDLLAFDRRSATLVLIEVKTLLDDLGSMERQIGWYERSALGAAHRLGWRPHRAMTWLLVLATTANEITIQEHRDIFDAAFPVRARVADTWLRSGGPVPVGRTIALIDPASRRRVWLIPTRHDGRRSTLPYRDHLDARDRLGSASDPCTVPRCPTPVPLSDAI
jgi:transcriptional regulator with XRE-family HTH domain